MPLDELLEDDEPPGIASRAAALWALLPGAFVVFFSFNAGGFFPGATAAAAIALTVLLLLRVTLAERPFAGLSGPHVACVALLGLFAVLTLSSAAWSNAPGRAVLEYDRAVMYLLAFVVLASPGRTNGALRWMARGLAAAIFAVCACALVTRVAPDLWAVASGPASDRLSWPLTYWNALGLLASLGIVLCVCLTSDAAESRATRVLAAAAIPVLAATLLLTFSRGAMAAGVIGLVAAIAVARPRALLAGALVAVPGAGVAIAAAYDAELLASDRVAGPAAIEQGHELALVVALCMVVCAAARAALLPIDARVARWRLPPAARRPAVVGAAIAVLLVAGAGTAVALGAPAELQRQYDRFVEGDTLPTGGDVRARLTQAGNNGRLDNWDVALRAFESEPLRGRGAGTYAFEWERHREMLVQVEDGHSLYLEVMAELGAAGLLLLGGAILLMLGALLARARGPDRVAAGALFAAALAWAVHAGIDWDWEMPAVTMWVFAAGGTALASTPGRAGSTMGRTARILVGLGCLMLAALPARALVSERALRDSRSAFARGDCPVAIDRALDSAEALGSRAEPFVIIGFCDVRLGEPMLAVDALQKAVEREPDNWEHRYGLALVRAAAGLDPRPAAHAALRLNPGEELAADGVARFDTADPAQWRRRALSARLPTE